MGAALARTDVRVRPRPHPGSLLPPPIFKTGWRKGESYESLSRNARGGGGDGGQRLPSSLASIPPSLSSVPPIRTLKLALQNSERASQGALTDTPPPGPGPARLPLFVLFLVGTKFPWLEPGSWFLPAGATSFRMRAASWAFVKKFSLGKFFISHLSLPLLALATSNVGARLETVSTPTCEHGGKLNLLRLFIHTDGGEMKVVWVCGIG